MSRRSRSQVFALRQLDLDLTKHEFAGLVLLGRIQNRRLAFLFVTLQERIDEKVNISRHLCLLLRYASWLIVNYTKAAKAGKTTDQSCDCAEKSFILFCLSCL